MRGYKCLIRHVYKLSINPNHEGSFENEALENEDRSTKHPKLENEAPKIENEAPNIENEAPKTRKRSIQNTRHRSALYKHETNVNTVS